MYAIDFDSSDSTDFHVLYNAKLVTFTMLLFFLLDLAYLSLIGSLSFIFFSSLIICICFFFRYFYMPKNYDLCLDLVICIFLILFFCISCFFLSFSLVCDKNAQIFIVIVHEKALTLLINSWKSLVTLTLLKQKRIVLFLSIIEISL